MDVIHPPNLEQSGSGEVVYEHFDCPQVQATYNYCPQQADDLGLVVGDIVKVFRKMPDGWYEGEKLRDGEFGWFPSTYVKEIESEHTRARNLKQRYQLIVATERLLPHSKSPTVLKKTKSRLSDLFS
jgi:neuronal guanine nucleotide exchange factor